MKKTIKKFAVVLLTLMLLTVFAFTAAACGESDEPGPGPGLEPEPSVTEYTVTFDNNYPNAPAATTVKVEEGKQVAEPETDPARAGHDFTGWYTTAAATTAYDFGSAVTANLTLYAGWAAHVTVTFVYGDYTGAPEDEAVELSAGGKVTAPSSPVREGYLFLGWFTDEACTTEFDFTSAVTANVTLYAGWMEESADVVSVTFDYNYAGAPAAATTYVENGATVAERGVTDRENTIASDDGKYSYTFSETAFAGWYTDEACTVEYDFSTPVTENITLYAGWEPTTYTFEAELTPLVGKTGEGYSFSVADEQLIRVDTARRNQNASMGYSVGYLYKYGHSLNYRVYSDRAVSNVTLRARLSAEYRDIYIAPETTTVGDVTYESYSFNVNDTSVSYSPIALEGARGTAEADQRPFDDWLISRTVSLKEGWNTIDLVTTNMNELASNITAMAPMIDCIYLSTDAELSWEPVWANLDNTEIIDG